MSMLLTGKGKMLVLLSAIAVVIIFTTMYIGANTQAGILEEDVNVNLKWVKFKTFDEENNAIILEVTFELDNDSDAVLTLRNINYELYANDVLLGQGSASYEDIPLVGRPQVFKFATSGPIRTDFMLTKTPETADMWDRIMNGNIDGITWRTKGVAEIESSISTIVKEFDTFT